MICDHGYAVPIREPGVTQGGVTHIEASRAGSSSSQAPRMHSMCEHPGQEARDVDEALLARLARILDRIPVVVQSVDAHPPTIATRDP